MSDIPEVIPDMFARTIVRKELKPTPTKQQVTLRIGDDALEWFRGQGSCMMERLHQPLLRSRWFMNNCLGEIYNSWHTYRLARQHCQLAE